MLKTIGVGLVLLAATAATLPAQTFTTLHTFDLADGSYPEGGLIQAINGNLVGSTDFGGANAHGIIFEITPSGTLTTLYDFCVQSGCPDGAEPLVGLTQDTNGSLYGTTSGGGNSDFAGTVFKITLRGDLTTFGNFAGNGLIEATNGFLYGTSRTGGTYGAGTIFKMSPGGKVATLYNFCAQSGCAEGPNSPLVQATNGNLYGTTYGGGANGYGTVFRVTPSGVVTILYSFCSRSGCADGSNPAGLVLGADGDLYGTTAAGGATDCLTAGCGTIFKITPSGSLTTVYTVCATGCTTSSPVMPEGGLVQATDGNFYGTSYFGGVNNFNAGGYGTIFKIAPSGQLTSLYSFCSQTGCADGAFPTLAPLVQATNGDIYGVTPNGGSPACYEGCGTVFRLSVGLGPFIETLPLAGKTGSTVKILGTDLTQTSSVTFNGVPAQFTVVSASLITAIVPASATTGTVQAIEPGGTLSSNVRFRVSGV